MKKEMPFWMKTGIVFFVISLISSLLSLLCWSTTSGDGGLICLFPALPLLPSIFLFEKSFGNLTGTLFLFEVIFVIFVNTIVGIIVGTAFGLIFKRKGNNKL